MLLYPVTVAHYSRCCVRQDERKALLIGSVTDRESKPGVSNSSSRINHLHNVLHNTGNIDLGF